ASRTARSASSLRFTSTLAFFRPAMSVLYERPFSRAAALMRTIHSLRKSRFFNRRCSYANWPARCCVWSAVLYSLLRPLNPPFAPLRTFLRGARPGTTVLERGICLSSCPCGRWAATGRVGQRDRTLGWGFQLPSILRTRAWSAAATTTFEPFLRFELRLSEIMPCRRFDERRIALPVPESLKRFRAARFDFILGIGCSFRSAGGRGPIGGTLFGADLVRGSGALLRLR